MATLLTEVNINSLTRKTVAGKQDIVQAARYFPIIVDLSAEITLGRAILEALNADTDLASAFLGETVTAALTLVQENRVLDMIEYIAYESPANSVQIRAVSGDSTNVTTAPSGVNTYKPVAEAYRNYVFSSGGSAIALGLGLS